jgi:hypothetical protein
MRRVIALVLVLTVPLNPLLSRFDLGGFSDPAGGTRAERSDRRCGKADKVVGRREHAGPLKRLPTHAFSMAGSQGEDSLRTVSIAVDDDRDAIRSQRNDPLLAIPCRYIPREGPSAFRDPEGGNGVWNASILLPASSIRFSCVVLRC